MDSVCRDDCSVCSPRTLVETTLTVNQLTGSVRFHLDESRKAKALCVIVGLHDT